MPFIKHKKVELTELFYDLVYVYTISQLTSIIHHGHDFLAAFDPVHLRIFPDFKRCGSEFDEAVFLYLRLAVLYSLPFSIVPL